MNTINIQRKFKFVQAQNDFYLPQKLTEKCLFVFSIAQRFQNSISFNPDGDLSQDVLDGNVDQKLEKVDTLHIELNKNKNMIYRNLQFKNNKNRSQGVMDYQQKKKKNQLKDKMQSIFKAEQQIHSQQQDILIKMSQWRVVYNKQKTSLDQLTTLNSQSTILQVKQLSEASIKTTEIDQNKVKQAKSLVNYISAPFNNHIAQTLNLMMLTFGIIDNKISDKISTLSQKMNYKLETCKQQLKTTKTKMILCFSSKWRQSQITLYLLIRPFNSNSKQCSRVRIHILNHRGLILQTVSNLDQQKYLEQISAIITKHYKRLYNIIVIPPQSNICNLDQFIIFTNIINKNSTKNQHFSKPLGLALFNHQSKKTLSESYHPQKQNIQLLSTNKNEHLSIWKDNKNQMLFWYNQNIQLQTIPFIIKRTSEIINRQERLAQFFDKYDYHSGHFNQKQILLRLFAFYFNFITLELMIPESKEELLHKVVDSEENIFQNQQKELQSINFQSKTHTFIVHNAPLPCSVCKKRTKSRCEKCSLDFNKLFGLCQKECFQKFHADIIKYREEIQKSKRVYSRLQHEKNQQSDDLIDLSGSNGRKRLKLDEQSQNKVEQRKQKHSLESLKDKWKSYISRDSKQFEQFYQYGSVGLISPYIMKKVEYIRLQLSQTKIQISNEPLVKQE